MLTLPYTAAATIVGSPGGAFQVGDFFSLIMRTSWNPLLR